VQQRCETRASGLLKRMMTFATSDESTKDQLRAGPRTLRRGQLTATALTSLLCILASSCALFPMVPWPELGEYALGMTYEEALAATGDFTGGRKPRWPEWPPTSMPVHPPCGTRNMRLLFTGQCVSAIEVTYTGACEDGLAQVAARKYGAPLSRVHGEHLWSDGVRDVTLLTRPDDEPFCKPLCTPTCVLTYRLTRLAFASGSASATHGIAACRAMEGRHRVRWRVDPLHTIQRYALDELGYLLRVDSRPSIEP